MIIFAKKHNKKIKTIYLFFLAGAFISLPGLVMPTKHFLHVNECINRTTPAITIIHLEYVVSHNANIITTKAIISSHQLLHIFSYTSFFIIKLYFNMLNLLYKVFEAQNKIFTLMTLLME